MSTFITKSRLITTTIALVLFFTTTFLGLNQVDAAPKTLTLTSFKTSCARSAILVMWTTDMERYTQGYNLYRSTTKSALGERLNTTMIPKNGGNGAGSYLFNDNHVQVGTTYFYTVEEIALNGGTTLHGPTQGNLNCAPALNLR